LTNNPNRDVAGNPANPRRLDPANLNDVLTCDQDHGYTAEQQAFDGGKMDKFLTSVGTAKGTNGPGQPCQASDVMHYYDGNTTTGLWNYAQQYAMSDNSFGTTFGPSTPGAINLASGNNGGVGLAINGATTNGPCQRTANEPLVVTQPVEVGSVDQSDALVDGGPDCRSCNLVILASTSKP